MSPGSRAGAISRRIRELAQGFSRVGICSGTKITAQTLADLTPVYEWFIALLNNAKTFMDGRKEDGVCRFYHGAFKVLERLQPLTRGYPIYHRHWW